MNIHQSPIVKFFNIDEDEELTFLKQFFLQQYTPANLNFCWLLKLFLRSPIHFLIEKNIYCHRDNSSIPCIKPFVLRHR